MISIFFNSKVACNLPLHFNDNHTVKILGFRQKKLYKGFYAKNVVPYTYEDDI